MSTSNSSNSQDIWLEEAKRAIVQSNAIYFQAFIKNDASLFLQTLCKGCSHDAAKLTDFLPGLLPEFFVSA
jgi:hypothetical protein